MTINLEEVLTNYLALMEQNKSLEASIEMTAAIRDIYFNSPELVNTELFKLMIFAERKEINSINKGVGFRKDLRYKDSVTKNGNIALSNLNTLLLIKMKKAGVIEQLSDQAQKLVQEETRYLGRFGIDTILERTTVALYNEEGISFENEARFTARNLSVNFPRFKNLENLLHDHEHLLDCERLALNEIEQYYEGIPNSEKLKWLSRMVLSLIIIYWGLGYETQRNYLLLKLKNLIDENNHFYWLVQFLCKELI